MTTQSEITHALLRLSQTDKENTRLWRHVEGFITNHTMSSESNLTMMFMVTAEQVKKIVATLKVSMIEAMSITIVDEETGFLRIYHPTEIEDLFLEEIREKLDSPTSAYLLVCKSILVLERIAKYQKAAK